MKPKHNISIPNIVRFMWSSGTAKELMEEKINIAKRYLLDRYPIMLVEKGIADFAPISNTEHHDVSLGKGVIVNHYFCRWSTDITSLRNHPHFIKNIGVYGNFDRSSFNTENRWDLMRDLYQLALAPDCCKKAYFDSPDKDPYVHLYENEEGIIKRVKSGEMNSLLAPLGLFISPIVPCSLHCEHARAKALEIAEGIKNDNREVYELLKVVCEMPLRLDTYRGFAQIDTPMFIGVYGTDAYKDKYILDFKPNDAELFNYQLEWVANGNRFPFKGIFSI